MLNDHFIFQNHLHVPSSEFCNNYNHYLPRPYCDLLEREYIHMGELEELEGQWRGYEAALRQKVYLEALERKRKERKLEERKQYIMEIECRQHAYEQVQEKKYLAHLERKRQERLNEERVRNKMAQALEALKKQKERNSRRSHVNTNLAQQTIQGPDGNLYKVLVNPNNFKQRHFKTSPLSKRGKEGEKVRNSLFHDTFNRNKLPPQPNPIVNNSSPCRSSRVQNISIQDCLNMNTNDGQIPSVKTTKTPKNNVARRPLKSSILEGAVEDASDSESEDVFNDYRHTRRPQSGEWIEPVESI